MRLSALGTVIIFAFVVAALLVGVGASSYPRRVRAPATLTPSSGLLKMVSDQAGVVQAVHVKEGEWVLAGKPLVTVAVDQRLVDGRVSDLLKQATAEQIAAIDAQHAASVELSLVARRELAARRSAAAASLETLRARISLAEKQAALAEETLTRGRAAHMQGYVSGNQYRHWQSLAAAAQDRLLELREREEAGGRELAEIAAQERRIPLGEVQNGAHTLQLRSLIAEKQAGLATAGSVVIAAERPGRVVMLNVQAGQAVESGAAVAAIMPNGARLMAEAWVPSKDVGFLQVGDEVRLRFDSFPYQQFGAGRGRLVAISNAPLQNGATGNQPAFRVVVALERQSVRAHGREWPLLPGMQLQADIILERRPLSAWIAGQLVGTSR